MLLKATTSTSTTRATSTTTRATGTTTKSTTISSTTTTTSGPTSSPTDEPDFEYHDNEVDFFPAGSFDQNGGVISGIYYYITALNITNGQDPDGKNWVGQNVTSNPLDGGGAALSFTVGRKCDGGDGIENPIARD